MNILTVCDGEDSSATIVMRQLAPHSQHNIKIVQWNPTPYITDNIDLIYYHYGGLLAERNPELLKTLDFGIPVAAGLRGAYNLKQWVNEWPPETVRPFVDKLLAISCANHELKDVISSICGVPAYVCHSGVDTSLFVSRPPPDEFCIGWAGDSNSGAKMFWRFKDLPFTLKTAAAGQGTWRKHEDMPRFYQGISIYVSVSAEEGSPVCIKEALASGRPVLSTHVGDVVEYLPDEWLFASHLDMVPVLEMLRDDKALYGEWSRLAREVSSRLTYDIVVREYDCMFKTVEKLR